MNISNKLSMNKEEISMMYSHVNNKPNVTYITFITEVGVVKCYNFNNVTLDLMLVENNQIVRKAYTENLTEIELSELKNILTQASISNNGRLNKTFKFKNFVFYGGDIKINRSRSNVTFYDSYFVAENIEIMEERFKHAIIKYSDCQCILTQ